MILSLKANHQSFKSLFFKKGFNIILADVTEKSTQHDSRNGAGKSTIVEIIQYCLGSRPDKKSIFFSEKLIDWCTSLLSWLSRKQVEAAKARIKNCNSMIHSANKAKMAYLQKHEKTINALENERERMEYFLSQDAGEL